MNSFSQKNLSEHRADLKWKIKSRINFSNFFLASEFIVKSEIHIFYDCGLNFGIYKLEKLYFYRTPTIRNSCSVIISIKIDLATKLKILTVMLLLII
jgi:hypothetical protein